MLAGTVEAPRRRGFVGGLVRASLRYDGAGLPVTSQHGETKLMDVIYIYIHDIIWIIEETNGSHYIIYWNILSINSLKDRDSWAEGRKAFLGGIHEFRKRRRLIQKVAGWFPYDGSLHTVGLEVDFHPNAWRTLFFSWLFGRCLNTFSQHAWYPCNFVDTTLLCRYVWEHPGMVLNVYSLTCFTASTL